MNQAKSNLDLEALILNAVDALEQNHRITLGVDSYLLARFYIKKMQLHKHLDFCKLLSKHQLAYERMVVAMLLCYKDKTSRSVLSKLEKYIKPKDLQKTIKAVTRKAYQKFGVDYGILMDSPKLQGAVQLMVEIMNAHSQDFDNLLINFTFDRTTKFYFNRFPGLKSCV